ncbi:MAG: type II secretion system protein [Candidatus Saccharimonadales bacterium]|jgi:prepilin-type N-terminal cleavage/methylation domain-containing protein
MRRGRKQRGFTIVEVLIVLAVTSAMFVMAAYAINGKQNQAEFQQAVNDIRSSIQQEIDQVAAGNYADTGNFTCNGSVGIVTILPGVNKQGSNTGCIYLGKVLQFAVKNTNPEQYISYSIAGLQDNNGSLTAALPQAIAPGATKFTNDPNASVTHELHDGLHVVSMTYNGNNVGAVAFISSLGQYSGGSLLSGSQTISLIPIVGSSRNATSASAVDAIDTHLATSPQNPSGGVQICFASGGTNESGLITIGGGGRDLSVTLQIKENLTCS